VISRRLLLLSPLLVVLLAACEIRTHLVIDAADLSAGTVTGVIGFDEEFRDLMQESGGGSDPMAELEAEAEAEGWEAEPFVDGDIEGYRVSKAFTSLEELQEIMSSGMTAEEWGYTDLRIYEEGGDFVFEAAGGNPMEEFTGGEGLEGVADLLNIDFQIAVTFPGPVKEHNGDLVERTVTWDLDSPGGDIGDLYGRSSIGGGFPWALIGGLVLALVVVGAVVWRLRSVP